VIPNTVEDLAGKLDEFDYFSDESLTVAIHIAVQLGRPLFLEGEAGVGKTEVAKVLARMSGSELIRLQCYEGLDVGQALYEWDYARQMMAIRLLEASGKGSDATPEDIMSREYLIARPLLRAIEASTAGNRPVLLIDELDRADPSRIVVRLPGVDPRDRHDQGGGASDRCADVEPDPGDPRRPQAALCLPLDRLSDA
jgi:MoxR-like ATPase